jgi:conjugal transfer/entry exclusion protein
MAQDFYNLFKLGTDDKSISSIDPAGIALKAIQYQQSLLEAGQTKNTIQQKQIDALQNDVQVLKDLLKDIITKTK